MTHKTLDLHVKEAARKIAWKIFFKINPSTAEKSDLDEWFISCKKIYKKTNKTSGVHYEFEDKIIDSDGLYKSLKRQLTVKTHSLSLQKLITELQSFCSDNNIMIIEADKNAGICIVRKIDYENEILRQLNDLNTYYPSTQTQFELAMIEFTDKVRCFDKSINATQKLSSLLPLNNYPAKFYILPKIHKPFEHFPKGRPISSTFQKFNKFPSKLLDFVLKPCINEIKDLLIDTQHFLLLLQEVQLQPGRKYTLVTIDIESLYTNLEVNDCRRHCINAYLNSHKQTGIKMNANQINQLISLSLGYNYVNFDDKWYIQHKGIEMGNAASVMVANITVYNELCNIFDSQAEISFYKRFLDDMFLIIDTTEIDDISEWLNTRVKHRYLKFTWEFSEESINFLDVTVKLQNNILHTELYSKPMSKHLFLHASSNHPSHLKNSLFFSQGLRIIRICSEYTTRLKCLVSLFVKFSERWYMDNVLYNTFIRLAQTKRQDTLRPKNKLLIEYLQVNDPFILGKYGQVENMRKFNNENDAVVVFPFLQHVHKYKHKVQYTIKQNVLKTIQNKWKRYVLDLNVHVVFSRTKNLKEMLR